MTIFLKKPRRVIKPGKTRPVVIVQPDLLNETH
jgi:mRNA-degrading endonuclease toxin of MazEF toxin-antitoxin module